VTSIGDTRGPERTAWRGLAVILHILFTHRRAAERGATTPPAAPNAAFAPEAARDAGLRRDHLDNIRPAPLRTIAPARLHRIAERTRAGLPPW